MANRQSFAPLSFEFSVSLSVGVLLVLRSRRSLGAFELSVSRLVGVLNLLRPRRSLGAFELSVSRLVGVPCDLAARFCRWLSRSASLSSCDLAARFCRWSTACRTRSASFCSCDLAARFARLRSASRFRYASLFSFEGGGGFGVTRPWTCSDRGRLFTRGVTRAKAAAVFICPSGRVVIAAYRTMFAAGGGF